MYFELWNLEFVFSSFREEVLGLTGEGTICQKFTDAFPNVGIKVGDVIVQVRSALWKLQLERS